MLSLKMALAEIFLKHALLHARRASMVIREVGLTQHARQSHIIEVHFSPLEALRAPELRRIVLSHLRSLLDRSRVLEKRCLSLDP